MLQKLIDAGFRFSFSEDSVVPEIPRVIDVLYAMDLVEEQECYAFCVNNHAPYIENVGLVIAAVAMDVLCPSVERYDEDEARKLIAKAIVALCPDETKCLFVGAYTDALRDADKNAPDVAGMTRNEQILACGCARCLATAEHELLISPGLR